MNFWWTLLQVNRRDLKLVLITLTLLLTLIPLGTYIYFAQDLISAESIMNKNNTGVVLFDREGKPFFTLDQAKYQIFTPLAEIPLYTQQAIMTVEDRQFWEHPGFSLRGIVRSVIINLIQQDLVAGGSTITQQLVKNALLNSRKSFLRKYQEVILAQEIERRFSKKEILEMYLNSVYFGQGAFGVGEAARVYFNKEAKELTLSESTLLAALLPAPSKLSQNPVQLQKHQKQVLQKMLEQKYITRKQQAQLRQEPLRLALGEHSVQNRAPHFAFLVREELIKRYGEETVARSGFQVVTTLNFAWQEYAQRTVTEQVKNLAGSKVTNGAAVILNPKTGEILSLVGSVDWFNNDFGKVNVVTSLRQPGSAFKPIVYVTGFEQGIITPATLLKDEPITYQIPGSTSYQPVNFDRKFRGPVLVRRALANSLNVPSVAVMSKVGVAAALEMAQHLGVTTLKDSTHYGPSLVLGAGEVKLLELTAAYGVFANSGMKNTPTTILKINDKLGREIYSYKPTPQPVLTPEASFLISSILSDSSARAEIFGNTLNISRPAAVKTGTTEDFRDSLTLGYTPSLVIGAWVGNNNGAPMSEVAGSLGAAPIWKSLMESFLAGTPIEPFSVPANMTKSWVCRQNGLLLKEASSSGILEYFIKDTEPKGFCILDKDKDKKARLKKD